MLVGAFSAAKMGTVDPFAPMPSPITRLCKAQPSADFVIHVDQELPCNEETLPILGEPGSDRRCDEAQGCNEDCSASTEVVWT